MESGSGMLMPVLEQRTKCPNKGSCTTKKSGLTLELSQRGGRGGQGPIQSKRSTFCHRQVLKLKVCQILGYK